MSASVFTQGEADVLGQFADLLIPGSDEMPAASEVGVHRSGAERVLDVRPELAAEIRLILAHAESVRDLAELQRLAGPSLPALCELVAGAYFTTPAVLEAIGYPGRPARELGDLVAHQCELEMLTADLAQAGPRWRQP